jgi:hypothetical protein
MPSAYTARLKLEKQASGENSGTWGDLVNYTFNRLDASIEGYQAVNVAGSANVTLTSNNATTNTNDSTTDDQVHNRTLELTGTLTGNINVFTGDVENSFLVFNNTSGSYTLTFGPTTGTGVVLKQGAKTLVYSDASTMFDVMADLGDITATSITPGSVKFADDTGIQDAAGNEQVYFSQAATAVNYLDITNAAAGAAPNVAAVGGDANVSLSLMAKGSGTVQASGNVVSTAGLQTMFIPAQAMFGTTTNGAESAAVETTATRPEMKVLDFDASTIEYSQFSVAMPKSWDEGVITFQAFWSPSNTDTGAALIGLQGVSVANDGTSDVTFDTAVDVTDNGTGTVEDVLVSPVSANVTVKTAAADTYTYFQVARNATSGSDSFTGDVRLLGIKLFYTTDAANDA